MFEQLLRLLLDRLIQRAARDVTLVVEALIHDAETFHFSCHSGVSKGVDTLPEGHIEVSVNGGVGAVPVACFSGQ